MPTWFWIMWFAMLAIMVGKFTYDKIWVRYIRKKRPVKAQEVTTDNE